MTILALLAMAPLPASKVVQALENHYQPLFQDMALTKPTKWKVSRAGKPDRIVEGPALMGGSRMEVWELVEGGHGRIQFPVGYADQRLEKHVKTRMLAKQALQDWRDNVYLVGNKTNSLKPESLSVRHASTTFRRYGRPPTELSYEAILGYAATALRSGKKLTAKKDGWTVAVSPIVFKDQRCLTCHTKSKKGDFAGLIVYTLRPEPRVKEPDLAEIYRQQGRKPKNGSEKGNEPTP